MTSYEVATVPLRVLQMSDPHDVPALPPDLTERELDDLLEQVDVLTPSTDSQIEGAA